MGICKSQINQQPKPNTNMVFENNQNIIQNNINGENNIKKMSFGDIIDDYSKNLNDDTFIGEFNNNENNINIYIIAEIFISDYVFNEEIRIINSYEGHQKNFDYKIESQLMNEKEIKNCKIRINNKLIPFKYYIKFPKKGKYIIKYSFNHYLTKTNNMFSECYYLTNINLSNFNTQNVTNMGSMFSECRSLTNINLSNLNTQNVTNMSHMFSFCSSLTNINLSNFNNENVTDMSYMFYGCSSLIYINLSNFNILKVPEMICMFNGCSSLRKENIITNDKRILDQFLYDKNQIQ